MKRRYKYTLSEAYEIADTGIKGFCIVTPWVSLRGNGRMTIAKGYSWDGASPTRSILDLFWVGTPDGVTNCDTGKPMLYYATAEHDALMQLRGSRPGMPLKEINRTLKRRMDAMGFSLSTLYYGAVVAYWFVTETWLTTTKGKVDDGREN